jgi:hypothetical protein
MSRLPPELLGIIFSFLESGDLWVLAQVSRVFQCLALSPLFASYDLSASQIDSGAVSLPGKAAFLVPRIHRIRPIQKLTILPGTLPIRSLSSILAATPQIPDVMIYPCTRGLKTREVAGVIAPLCRPVIIVRTGEGEGRVSVSSPQLRPPISLRSLHDIAETFSAPTFILNTLTGPWYFVCAFGWYLLHLAWMFLIPVPLCLNFYCASLISASVWPGCTVVRLGRHGT